MESVDLTDYAATLIQLPIVGLFIWVVFRFMKEHREEREQISKQYREEREAMIGRYTESSDKASDAITDLSTTTREFHTEVREWRRENERRSHEASR